jgi:F-type H+-transporting ATPase subunit b
MISINATLIVQIFQFLILMFILNRLLFRPILKVMNDRDRHVSDKKDEIENLELETLKLRDEYTSREVQARKKASQERATIVGEGMSEADVTMEESRKKVYSIRETAEKEAQEELNNSKPFLHEEAAVLADDIIERVLGRRIAG